MKYTLKLWMDDMGSFTQPGCRDEEDARWHINAARRHDGLEPISASDLGDMLRYPDSSARATLTAEAQS